MRNIIFKNYHSSIGVFVDGKYLYVPTGNFKKDEEYGWANAVECVVDEINRHFNLDTAELEKVKEEVIYYFD